MLRPLEEIASRELRSYGRRGQDGLLYPDERGEGCFTVRAVSGETGSATLPGVLAGIEAAARLRWGDEGGGGRKRSGGLRESDALADMPRIPTIEKRFFLCFIVQLMAIAHEDELSTWAREGAEGTMPALPSDEDSWREALLGMAPVEAWRAIGAGSEAEGEPATMAFLQPPYERSKTKLYATEPSGIDWLMRGKGHEAKMGDGRHRLEDWIYVLTSKATSDGFVGRGGHGSVRMKGGTQCRIYGAIEPEGSFAEIVAHQAEMLRLHLADLHSAAVDGPKLIDHKGRDALRHELLCVGGEWNPEKRLSGERLTWTLPWEEDKKASIPVDEMHPCFIEACRTLQLIDVDGDIACLKRTSKCMRLSARNYEQGVRTDPWHFVIDGEAMGMGSAGFPPDFIARSLLDERVHTGPMMGWPTKEGQAGVRFVRFPTQSDYWTDGHPVRSDMRVHVEALARGMGKIEGYFHTVSEVPQIILEGMRNTESRRALLEKAEEIVAFLGRDGTIQELVERAVSLTLSNGERQFEGSDRIGIYVRRSRRRLRGMVEGELLLAIATLGTDGTVSYRMPDDKNGAGVGDEARDIEDSAEREELRGGMGRAAIPSIREDDLLAQIKRRAAKIVTQNVRDAAEGGLLREADKAKGLAAGERYVSAMSEGVFGVGPRPF